MWVCKRGKVGSKSLLNEICLFHDDFLFVLFLPFWLAIHLCFYLLLPSLLHTVGFIYCDVHSRLKHFYKVWNFFLFHILLRFPIFFLLPFLRWNWSLQRVQSVWVLCTWISIFLIFFFLDKNNKIIMIKF